MKISVIIVNYNVKRFLEQALHSAQKALSGIESEIFVVDNASVDGSAEMVRQRFPEVRLIASRENLGFSKANNLAIGQAAGDFIVLLNPDTVVQEDTFQVLLDFFNHHPEAGAATCKIINPDGSFSIDCRHSIPTPSIAFWKVTGLSSLFPKSRLFGRYNLTYLDENQTAVVEAISGSFMMIRKQTVQKVGLLDETFFMYCEDIDYCHRLNQTGEKIYYVPATQIIHYKGESTKKNNIDYVVTFNKSLYQFYKKHYQQRYILPFQWLIWLGVVMRGLLIFARNNLKTFFPVLADIFILNAVFAGGFALRYLARGSFSIERLWSDFGMVNLLASLLFFFSGMFFNTHTANRLSLIQTIKSNAVAHLLLAAVTFFLPRMAFSRLVVALAFLTNTSLMILWRIIFRNYARRYTNRTGEDYFARRTLLVGLPEDAGQLSRVLDNRVDSGIRLYGLVSPESADVGRISSGQEIVCSLENMPEYIRLNRINLVIFTTKNISYTEILNAMSQVGYRQVEFKMVPEHLEYMIGKAQIEPLTEVSLLDLEFALEKPFNQFIKRLMDLVISIPLVILGLPAGIVFWLISPRRTSADQTAPGDRRSTGRFWFRLLKVVRGSHSLVGFDDLHPASFPGVHSYKPGLTGIIRLNQTKIRSEQHRRNLEIHYLKNQSLILDLEILLKSVWSARFLL